MKGYTDLSQSKKLAEFLPLKSADMCYIEVEDNILATDYISIKRTYENSEFEDTREKKVIPCWSLAALLELMPKKIKYDGGIVYPEFHIWNNSFEYNNNADYVLYITNNYDNPVDACYEMIIHLHSKHLL